MYSAILSLTDKVETLHLEKYTHFGSWNFDNDSLLKHPFLHNICVAYRDKNFPDYAIGIHAILDAGHKKIDVHFPKNSVETGHLRDVFENVRSWQKVHAILLDYPDDAINDSLNIL